MDESLDKVNGALLASRIANRIYDLRKLGDFNGDTVIIRDGLSKASILRPADLRRIFERVKARIGTCNVQFLTCTKQSVRNLCLWRDCDSPLISLGELSQVYIDNIMSDPHVVYRMNGDDTFQLPSGVESNIFYRVGNAQKDIFVLDDVFIFLFPYLKRCKTIVAETWSISTICYHAAKRIEKICGRDSTNVLFLSNYFDDTGEPERELHDILTRAILEKQTPVTLIFSATATGLSWDRIKRRIRPHLTKGRDLEVISLLKLGEGNTIPHLSKRYAAVSSPAGKPAYAVPINKKTYFPEFVSPAEVSVLQFTDRHKSFFELYAGRNIFRVHANSHTIRSLPSRHNAFYVSCEELFKADVFRDRAKEAIRNLPHPGTLLFLDTTPNSALAEIIDECFDVQTFKVTGSRLDEIVSSINSVGSGELPRPIWVVDSVAVSGTTLGLYDKLVRDNLPGSSVTFVVGLDRPDNADKLNKRGQNLRHVTGATGTYVAIEQVVLPNWGKEKCPWCNELRLLGGIPNSGNAVVDAPRNNRKSLLFAPGGLINDVYFVDRERVDDQVLKLGPRSLFLEAELVAGEVSQADVVCCVAAVAQQWRTSSKSLVFRRAVIDDGSQKLPLTTVLGPTTFNDPIIRAALWRVFSLEEFLPTRRQEVLEFDSQFAAIVSCLSSDVLNPLALEGALLLKSRLTKLTIEFQDLKELEAHIVQAIRSGV
ncbi:hypothetical protein FVA81_04700 [Rhizobium sp. WL3]|uniref:hypothetical protein n=1 Tax=Rhizobium sp. WL3 TaxID=2603277 RepID=UPI0011C201D7|nr:hypothetical protein [Rhizobium sp. WL3]QEE43953.1 hypothetical protein FVA81_04700 [Rhizobium sp. WL3]